MAEVSKNAYAVILAGGGGTRLWPKSRKSLPKHFINIVEEETMLQITYKRIQDLFPKERILVITNKQHVSLVEKQLPRLPKENIIGEPFPNNTALAMGAAAAYVQKRNPNGVIIYFAADHIIEDQKNFEETILASLDVAENTDNIVAIGMKPTFAHTGLGYIKIGDHFGKVKVKGSDVFIFKVKEFKEKPSLVTAQAFIASHQYLWNANIYCWSTKTILESFKEHYPSIHKSLEKILSIIDTKNEESELKKIYEKTDNIPIDYAIAEKAKNIVVIPGDFDWSDVGDWKVVYDIQEKDSKGNVVVAEHKDNYLNIDSKNCLIETNGRLVVTVGLDDLVVIDTEDAVLICDKNKAQDVKKAVEKLKELKKDKYL